MSVCFYLLIFLCMGVLRGLCPYFLCWGCSFGFLCFPFAFVYMYICVGKVSMVVCKVRGLYNYVSLLFLLWLPKFVFLLCLLFL